MSDFSFSKQYGVGRYFCPVHWHDCFEIIYVRHGKILLSVGSGSYLLCDGDIAVLPPLIPHGTESLFESFDLEVYGYTKEIVYSLDTSVSNMKYITPFDLGASGGCLYLAASDSENGELSRLLSLAMSEYDKNGYSRDLKVRAKILEIHAMIAEIYNDSLSNESFDNPYVRDAVSYIEEHLSEELSPYKIADALHISYSHLARLFKKVFSASVGEMITRMRIGAAERRISESNEKSITEIATECGFRDVSYFSSKFKAIIGLTPHEFRRMLRKT